MASVANRKQIFISHKETDERIAGALVDFILSAIAVDEGQVLCTSVPGHQLSFGTSTAEQLRKHLAETVALVAVLTPESLRSTWVLFELGSAWAMGKIVVPILGPGLDFGILPGPLADYQSVKIMEENARHRMKDVVKQIATALGVSEKTGAKPDAKLDHFIQEFRQWTGVVPKKTSPRRPISRLLPKETVPSEPTTDGEGITNSIGMKLVRVPAGEFLMGSHESEGGYRGEWPQHKVRITGEFYMGIYPVTQREFENLMGDNPSRFSAAANEARVTGKDTGMFPVENVTWDEAVQCCSLLSELPQEKASGLRYRLPTEAEWEYACRGGTTTPFNCGQLLSREQANFNVNWPDKGNLATEEVGKYKPNLFGLYDMHGNVQEWCSEWYVENYYEWSPAVDPPGPPGGAQRATRGGCWTFQAHDCRSAYRSRANPSRRDSKIGFRVAAERRV